jgi:hypothetical protein
MIQLAGFKPSVCQVWAGLILTLSFLPSPPLSCLFLLLVSAGGDEPKGHQALRQQVPAGLSAGDCVCPGPRVSHAFCLQSSLASKMGTISIPLSSLVAISLLVLACAPTLHTPSRPWVKACTRMHTYRSTHMYEHV